MRNMKAKVRKNILHIWLPIIDPPRLSKSGKTLLIASSNGPKRTALKINGKPAIAIVTVYVRPDGNVKRTRPKHWPARKSGMAKSRFGSRKKAQ
jgi:hypothetical protein